MQVFCTIYFLYLGMKTERKELRLELEFKKKMEIRAKQLGLSLTAYIHYCIAKELGDSEKEK